MLVGQVPVRVIGERDVPTPGSDGSIDATIARRRAHHRPRASITFLRTPRAVGHDAVHPEVEEHLHLGLVIDGPHVDREAGAVRGMTNRRSMRRMPQRCGTWRQSACMRGIRPVLDAMHMPSRRDLAHRRADPPSRERSDAGHPAVGERADAHAAESVEAVDELDQRHHGVIRLRVDVEEDVIPAREQFLERWNHDPGAAKRDRSRRRPGLKV